MESRTSSKVVFHNPRDHTFQVRDLRTSFAPCTCSEYIALCTLARVCSSDDRSRRDLFESNKFSELKPEEAFINAILIATDFVFRFPTLRDALNYQANGNGVCAYLFAVQNKWGYNVKGKPFSQVILPKIMICYRLGTRHMEELEHILSLTRDWRYPATNNRLQPADWAFDVTDFAENQWSYFGHFGDSIPECEEIGFKNYKLCCIIYKTI